MFGKMNVVPVVDFRNAPDEVGRCVDGAVARLLDVTEHQTIAKWVQLPKALLVFLVVPGDPESGANFLRHYRPLGDSWMLFDNAAATPAVIAFEKQGNLRIMNRETYESLIARYEKP